MAEEVLLQKNEEEEKSIDAKYEELRNIYLSSNHRKHVEVIDKAFKVARKAHDGVRRRSGEPYIMHPIAVAKIVAQEIGLGSTSIAAALLHDVVEDTDTTVEDLQNLFGARIATIVDGLTKISGGVFAEGASAQAENFRKLILTMSEDVRVILIKMADRLHNMRTLDSMPPRKQQKIAGETEYIYAPLANRLGLYAIKSELEDLSFKYDNPDKYAEISNKLEITEENRTKLFYDIKKPIRERLDELGINADIKARIKSIYSIHRKMQAKSIPFEEVFDILAIRIIFHVEDLKEEKPRCWQIYSAVTDLYKPHPTRTRDWISTPKANGYEALHVTVMGPDGKWIEVQIRSQRMDDIAEKGYAAHWKYKTGETDDSELEKWLQTIKELLKNPESNAIDFMDTFKLNLFANEVFVYTPKGEIKTMPQGATVLDFAFMLHTELGKQCIGAKVSHNLEPLNYVLQSGDQVEILTSKKQKPNPDWIGFVKTAKARDCVRQLFKKEYKAFSKKGIQDLNDFLIDINVPVNQETIEKIQEYYKEPSLEELYYKIGKGTLRINDLRNTLFKKNSQSRLTKIWRLTFGKLPYPGKEGDKPAESEKDSSNGSVVLNEEGNRGYRLAECCCPIPGDDVLGFKEDTGMIVIHKRTCPQALKLRSSYGNRIVAASWETHKELSYPADLEIKGLDRVGILREILQVISEMYKVNIGKMNVETNDGRFVAKFTVYIHDVEDINNLCMKISALKDINSVERIESKEE